MAVSISYIYKKRNVYKVSTLILFYFFVAGVVWIGEFIVLGLFNSYAYKTGIYKDLWAQNLLGHLILNATFYPAVIIAAVVYPLRLGRICSIVFLVVFLEYLFVRLGLYEQHWWRFYMTAVAVLALIVISKYWFVKMNLKPGVSVRAFTFYFIALLIIHMPSPILLLLGKQHYQTGLTGRLFKDFYLSSIVFVFAYHLVLSFFAVLFTCVLKKWYWKAVPFIFPVVFENIFKKIGILKIEDGWKLIYTILIYEAFVAFFVLLEKHTLEPGPGRPGT